MTDREILEQLLASQQKMQSDIEKLNAGQQTMQSDIAELRLGQQETNTRLTKVEENVTAINTRLTKVEENVTAINTRLTKVEENVTAMKLRLENTTDKNIQIIAENYSNLVQKLDKNNAITDQQFAYQIKVNYLMDDVLMLKKDVKELKSAVGI